MERQLLNLTLTSVVFEFAQAIKNLTPEQKHLTLTSVVFELIF